MLSLADASFLLQQSSRLERSFANLAERRRELILALGAAVNGQAGFWGWGRGRPFDSNVTPVAALHFGFAPEEWPRIALASLCDEVAVNFHRPVMQLVGEAGHACLTRSTVWSDSSWYNAGVFQDTFRSLELDHFLVYVRYFAGDSWSHLTIFRRAGQPDFTHRDRNLIEVGLTSIVWMCPSVAETIPPDAFAGLSARQRTVMLLLLDGLARKEIASRLRITLHTVNDHVKALYEHFGVTSATELGARFLRATA